MKIAIVQDYLCSVGGSERIFQYICEEYTEADVYTLAYNKDETFPYFTERKINTTWLNYFVRSTRGFRLLFPVGILVMKMLDLSKYDLVITSSATIAKYVKTSKGAHVCYCYIPTRAIWDADTYFNKGLLKSVFKLFLPILKIIDYKSAQNVFKFIAISNMTKRIIKETYDRDSEVINCPIDLSRFKAQDNVKESYLIVSRLEAWKKLDYAIEAFNEMDLPLRIVGTGPEEESLKEKANSNITFVGSVDDEQLANEYAKAKSVIFTPYIEYGLIPLEANASGAPVISYGYGGIEETMVSLEMAEKSDKKPTAVFFYEQTAQALIGAVKKFEKTQFNQQDLIEHANLWSIPAFKQKLRTYVDSVI